MRLWSLHPRYLDRQGLTACWRESLLAQAVIAGRTRGYRAHPQLERFREQIDPLGAVAWYLHGVADEADRRGYRFDRCRIDRPAEPVATILVTTGQLELEADWLRSKLAVRSPELLGTWPATAPVDPHPSFRMVPGAVATWERVRR